MATESEFVDVAMKVAEKNLLPPLVVRRGAALLYQVTVDNQLSPTVDVRRPVRGNSAFQTDLCIFEEKSKDICIPRVVQTIGDRPRFNKTDKNSGLPHIVRSGRLWTCSTMGFVSSG